MTDYVPREHLAVTATVDLAHRIHREVGPGLRPVREGLRGADAGQRPVGPPPRRG